MAATLTIRAKIARFNQGRNQGRG